MNTAKPNWWATGAFITLSVLSVVITGGIIWVMTLLVQKENISLFRPEITLPIMIVASLAVLVTILAILSAVMGALGVSDSSNALGMPEGSIRAVIALSLILIFIVSALYLYNSIEYTGDLSKGLPEAQFNTLLEQQPDKVVYFVARKDGETTVYDVKLRTEVGETSRNFATQILTIVGTLVGAVSGFYFGNKSLTTARGISVISSQPSITSVQPSEVLVDDKEPKAQPLKVFGAHFISVSVVKLKRENETDILATTFRPVNDKQIECTFDLAGKSAGKWTLCIINADGGEVEFKNLLVLTSKTA
jgi:hypothetical protein